MPIVDTTFRCSVCEQEYATVGEAEDCEARDRWTQKLEDNAGRLYEVVKDLSDGNAAESRQLLSLGLLKADALLADLGPPPPTRTT